MSEERAKLGIAALAAKVEERFPKTLARLHEAELAEAESDFPASQVRDHPEGEAKSPASSRRRGR